MSDHGHAKAQSDFDAMEEPEGPNFAENEAMEHGFDSARAAIESLRAGLDCYERGVPGEDRRWGYVCIELQSLIESLQELKAEWEP